jgi:hypothetical protein
MPESDLTQSSQRATGGRGTEPRGKEIRPSGGGIKKLNGRG